LWHIHIAILPKRTAAALYALFDSGLLSRIDLYQALVSECGMTSGSAYEMTQLSTKMMELRSPPKTLYSWLDYFTLDDDHDH
jgi:hypothetical protein